MRLQRDTRARLDSFASLARSSLKELEEIINVLKRQQEGKHVTVI